MENTGASKMKGIMLEWINVFFFFKTIGKLVLKINTF